MVEFKDGGLIEITAEVDPLERVSKPRKLRSRECEGFCINPVSFEDEHEFWSIEDDCGDEPEDVDETDETDGSGQLEDSDESDKFSTGDKLGEPDGLNEPEDDGKSEDTEDGGEIDDKLDEDADHGKEPKDKTESQMAVMVRFATAHLSTSWLRTSFLFPEFSDITYHKLVYLKAKKLLNQIRSIFC